MNKNIILILALVLTGVLGWHWFSDPVPEIRNPSPLGTSIVCFGDSLTYGTGASEGMDYPSRLSEMLGEPVVNAGVPGDTTGAALRRLGEDVLEKDPRIVLITLGGNDLKNGVAKEVAFDNLRQIAETIQAKGALVVLGGIDFPIRGREFGRAYIKFARDHGVVLIPNIYKGLLGKRSLMSDQIHPNDEGYAVIARKFYEAVKPYIL